MTSRRAGLIRPHPWASPIPRKLERVFKALGNETRRGILAVLHDHQGPMSSHDIAGASTSPGKASRVTCVC